MIIRVIRGIFAQLGTFLFIEAIVLSPLSFAAGVTRTSGTALGFVLEIIAVVLLSAATLSFAARRNLPGTRRFVGWAAIIFPTLSLLLPSVMLIGPMASLPGMAQASAFLELALICCAAVLQFHYYSFNVDAKTQELIVTSGASVLLSSLLFILVVEFMPFQYAVECLVAGALLVSGVVQKTGTRRDSANAKTPGDKPSMAATPGETATAPMTVKEKVLRSLPVVPLPILCAIGSGLVASSLEVPSIGIDANLYLAVFPLMVCFLALLMWLWRRFMSVDVIFIASVIPAILSLIPSISIGWYMTDKLVAIGFVIQVAFLMLGWLSALLLGRANSVSDSVAPSFFVALIVLMELSFLVGGFLDPAALNTILVAMTLVYLVHVIVYLFMKSRSGSLQPAQTTDATTHEDTLDNVLLRKCRLITTRYALSPRESEILPFLIMGSSSASIAERLFLSPATVKTHRYRIFCKMDVHNHEELLECVRAIEREGAAASAAAGK